MRSWRSLTLPFATTLSLTAQTLIQPGERVATIDAPHLRAFVPAGNGDELRALVARADQIYAHMQHDAGFVPPDKLRVLMADWIDYHNGYSFVVPFPLVEVELAPSDPESTIFSGGFDAERTLTHEFAHQISNDRNHGLRGVLQSVFGRVLPNDLLSLLVFYLSTPAHQTMPRFWQEGLAVWAETAYADPSSPWAGRGRDSLTHMIWRLDAAAGAIPQPADWRITQHEWPFGGEAYAYGAAYTRYLAGAFGDRASMWDFIDQQARQWAYLFNGGPRRVVDERHAALLQEAREALLLEQKAQLAKLRAQPVTTLQRLTPIDMGVGAPAWRDDGTLVFAAKAAQGRGRLHTLSPDGELRSSSDPTIVLGNVRALPDRGDDNGVVYHELNWRGLSHVVVDGVAVGRRLFEPDAGPKRDGARTLVAIQLRGAGKQDLVAHSLRDGELDAGVTIPTQGKPWSPALRRGAAYDGELVWVETDRTGSCLVLGSLRDPAKRVVLWSVRGRILHPAWSADGASLFCCADHTGVANAYRLDVLATGAIVTAITNTIGGVVACVPSPDGTTLALVDHDERGPFVARMANDKNAKCTVPSIELSWPAPGARPGRTLPTVHAPTTLPPLSPAAAAALTVEPYHGLGELRPLFWAPTTFAVPDGGYGVYGLAADPLLTHVIEGGAGVGFAEQEPVGFVSYNYLAEVVEFNVNGGRSERTFTETVLRGNERLDYTETVDHGEVRIGRNLWTLERQFVGYLAFGVDSHDEVNDVERRNLGGTPVKPPLTGTDHYLEATLGYDSSTFYPTSYSREDGFTLLGTYRHSGLGGDLHRNRAFADGGYTWSIFPAAGHQVVIRGQLGWSDGDDTLQGNFSVGGGLSTGLPRGYFNAAVATGRYLDGGSLAYRFPLWRPFAGASTAPFRERQLVLELFGDSVHISDERLGGSGGTFSSVGAELFANSEFADGIFSPGIGIAWQLDGQRDVRAYFSLGFSF